MVMVGLPDRTAKRLLPIEDMDTCRLSHIRLFIGEAGAGDRGAILYTIVECCRRRGFDPYTYLRDVLTRLPRMTNHQIHEVTPAAWAKAQNQLQRQAAS